MPENRRTKNNPTVPLANEYGFFRRVPSKFQAVAFLLWLQTDEGVKNSRAIFDQQKAEGALRAFQMEGFNGSTVVVGEPEIVKALLQAGYVDPETGQRIPLITNPGQLTHALDKFANPGLKGGNILTSRKKGQGGDWEAHRLETVNPHFSYDKIIHHYVPEVYRMVASEVEQWRASGKPIEILHAVQRIMVRSSTDLFLGPDKALTDKEVDTIIKIAPLILPVNFKRAMLPEYLEPVLQIPGLRDLLVSNFSYYSRLKSEMDEAFARRLDQASQEVQEGQTDDRLIHTIAARSDWSDEKKLGELEVLFSASFDTSAAFMSGILTELAQRPEWAGRIRAELVAVLDQSVTEYGYPVLSKDMLTGERLPNTVAFMQEVLRLNPPGQQIVLSNPEEINVGYSIPANTQIYIMPEILHTDEEYWGEDANEFSPERHLTADGQIKRNPSPYFIAFGEGHSRMCVGKWTVYAEAIVAVYEVLRNFDLSIPDGKAVTYTYNGVKSVTEDVQLQATPR